MTEATILIDDQQAEHNLIDEHQHTVNWFSAGGTVAPVPEDYTYDDFGMKNRFAVYYGEKVRYVPAWGWLVWDGRRWLKDDNLHVQRYAQELALMLAGEVRSNQDEATRTKILDLAKKYQSFKKREILLEDCQSHGRLIIRASLFDTNPWYFNVRNGTLNLKTGQLQKHQQRDAITKIAPINYNPDATCPIFKTFLARVFSDKQELISFVQKAVGYSLTGSQQEQCFFILYGTGCNGKSTFLNVFRNIFGSDYAQQTDASTFLEKKYGSIPNDVACLQGIRLAAATETNEGHRLNELFVKAMSGGEPLRARFSHKEFFEFQPTFKVWLATNHKPQIRGTDFAIWRRIRLIPFTITIPDDERDKNMERKLLEEREGIFTWSVEGCKKYLFEGLNPPDDIIEATDSYRTEMDVIGAFIEECCEEFPAAISTARDLYATYCQWCRNAGEHAASQRKFGLTLGERRYIKKPTMARTVWQGLGIKAEIMTEKYERYEP